MGRVKRSFRIPSMRIKRIEKTIPTDSPRRGSITRTVRVQQRDRPRESKDEQLHPKRSAVKAETVCCFRLNRANGLPSRRRRYRSMPSDAGQPSGPSGSGADALGENEKIVAQMHPKCLRCRLKRSVVFVSTGQTGSQVGLPKRGLWPPAEPGPHGRRKHRRPVWTMSAEDEKFHDLNVQCAVCE